MTIDGFISAHKQDWDRLAELTRKAGRDARGLSPEELTELSHGYQRASTHLSLARARFGDAALTADLSRLVARAAAVLYGTKPRTWRAAGRFARDTFPAALWHSRAFMLWSTLLFLVPALVTGAWLSASPAALEATGSEAAREAYVTEDFADYYTAQPSAQFATEVTVNNIQVAILAFAGGGLAALPTLWIMAVNGVQVGAAGGMFAATGELGRFFGLILPHGLLELTAVFIAGGAGLRVGWTIVDPGDRRRGTALAEEGRRAVTILIGLVAVFLTAGLIEGFVTGAPWPTWVRVSIGVATLIVFLAYVYVCGRQATSKGLTGAIGEQADAGWARIATASPST